MTRISAFSSPLLLGFDEVERALDRVAKGTGSGYPPYNIERLPRTNDRPETLRITLAVAGFSSDDLEVSVEERELTIRGRQNEDDGMRDYLHRGIAARQCLYRFGGGHREIGKGNRRRPQRSRSAHSLCGNAFNFRECKSSAEPVR